MVIGATMRGTTWFTKTLFRSAAYKFAAKKAVPYAKRRIIWYYRILLSEDFAQSITNMYDLNKFESKTNNFHRRVFCVDKDGNIYDNKTGEIFGNTGEVQHNKFDLDNEIEQSKTNLRNKEQKVNWEAEEVIIMPDKS